MQVQLCVSCNFIIDKLLLSMQIQKNITFFYNIYISNAYSSSCKNCVLPLNYIEPTQKKQDVYYLGIFDQGLC
jgi:hypothetical protein